MGYRSEIPQKWSKLWLFMWMQIIGVLLVSIPFVHFREWMWMATVGFGLPEGIALLRNADKYPPLTHIIRHFLPKWFTFTAIYGIFGTIAAYWLGFTHPGRLGALLALLGWLTAHFDTVYEE